uniref:Uncharacterized protein n=1 Tax=Aplanochytrium stocchinoi TaxID=215587 RepID=A0A7S3LRD5_9STRA|mmetsp:Transcript_6277/g.8239  ORF Transcript_6277/g.8239 Transcript_6277/m.8239 type:complete len:386 (+) Transcript_6277:778-1935(+)|eukprot:CAMPEP_0204876052 /NCGR_PEP_ID=MMETSP1348-20121228/47419_1 /ASSEMBLY_ACC=CAM_ASM_000700 /TAXON_ID=215587 /ORGANISM="Aplanochytrium stocchinoi, Strain GSBS06" /LENGTH=385 /DNA_ID=CAMNT_0052032761 /DNA_START=710 /DNA_END=1867 /DNA_ORIENTATION=-
MGMKRQRSDSGGTEEDGFDPSQQTAKKLSWTEFEDSKLVAAVEAGSSGRNSDGSLKIELPWCEIAKCLPNRNGKQCRERWCFNLDPCVKRGNWTAREDAILIKAQQRFGNQWIQVARFLKGRTENSVKTRFKSIVRAGEREWTEEEDDLILDMHSRIGCKWTLIKSFFPERTANAIKVRYRMIRKGKKLEKIPLGSPRQVWYQRNLIDQIDLNQILWEIELRKQKSAYCSRNESKKTRFINANNTENDNSVTIQKQNPAPKCDTGLSETKRYPNSTTILTSPVTAGITIKSLAQTLQTRRHEQPPQIQPLLSQNILPSKIVSPYGNLLSPRYCNSESLNLDCKPQLPSVPVASIFAHLMQCQENLCLQTTQFLLFQKAFACQNAL